MPYHMPAKHPALRGLGILALIVAMIGAELYRQWLGGYAAGGTRQ